MKWNFATIMEEAAKYQTRTQFANGSIGAYRAALRSGMIEALFPIEHVVIERIKPVSVRKVTHYVNKPSFDKKAINADVEWIMNDPDWHDLQYRAASDYTGEALTYYWQRINHKKKSYGSSQNHQNI